jgi:hypothetical protein
MSHHSVWDKYVDISKVMEMPAEERKKMFPHDFDDEGNLYEKNETNSD